jgi:TonB family protein
MNSLSIFDELDQAIDRLMGDASGSKTDLRSGIAELVEIVPDLRYLSRPEFKSRLKVELEWQAQGRALSTAPRADRFEADLDRFPTLSGKSNSLYPVRRSNFALSVALHAAMLLFVSAGLVMVKSTARVLEPRVTSAIILDPYVPPVGSTPKGGGGGGGAKDKLGASKGEAPRFAQEQIAPPVVVQDVPPKLQVEATLVGPPDLNVRVAQTGDPLSNLMAPSSGVGVSGVGSGRGDGLGPGTGPGKGPGSGGGSDGGVYSVGNGVSAPRAIYSPEPEFSDEARAAKYQGVVTLALTVRPDGRPANVFIVRALGMGLDQKALETVRTWRFEPGRLKDGRPVSVQIQVEVDFRLY